MSVQALLYGAAQVLFELPDDINEGREIAADNEQDLPTPEQEYEVVCRAVDESISYIRAAAWLLCSDTADGAGGGVVVEDWPTIWGSR